MELGLYQTFSARGVSTASTGVPATAAHCPGRPIDVVRFGFIMTVASTVSLVAVLKRRPTPGSASGEVALGTITQVVASRAIGSVLFCDIANARIIPGHEVAIDITTAGTTGVATVFIDFMQRGLHKRDTKTVAQGGYYDKLFDSTP